MKAKLLALIALNLFFFGAANAEEPKMKASDQTIKVKTELGVGRFDTILESFRKEGVEIGKLNHPKPPAEVEITYITYIDPGEADEVSPQQIEVDLRATGYRSATIEELASIDAGNSGLANNQKVTAFGTSMKISPTETLMFGAGIKDQKLEMHILKVAPGTCWKKRGLMIPAVKLKTPDGGKVTV